MGSTNYRLIRQDGNAQKLNRGITNLGRSSNNDLVVPSRTASRAHASILVKGGKCWVKDNRSQAGTYVNGRRISKATPLNVGDILTLGNVKYRLAVTSSQKINASPQEQVGFPSKQFSSRPYSEARKQENLIREMPASIPALWNRLTNGFKLSSAASAILLISFFLPWVSISCSGMEASMSGSDLAGGYATQGVQLMEGTPILFLLIVIAAGVLFLSYRWAMGYHDKNWASHGLYGLSFAGLLSLMIVYSSFSSEVGQLSGYANAGQSLIGDSLGDLGGTIMDGLGIRVSYGIGLVGTIGSLLTIAIGGELNRREL